MIPILFPSNATQFKTQGLGSLTDAVSCEVTEERNGEYELEMQYPASGIHFEEIQTGCIIFAIPSPYRQPQPFRIYQITRPINGVVTVYAQHISYDLSGVPVQPFTALSAAETMALLESRAAITNPFHFYTDITEVAPFSVSAPSAIRTVLGGQDASVLDVYGGEFEWDGFDVWLRANRGRDNGVTIRYGKNLTDLEQEQNIADMVTGILPYWQGDDGTIVQSAIVPAGEYDFQRVIPVDFTEDFEEAPTPEQLADYGRAYVEANRIGVPKMSMTAGFVRLEQFEPYTDLALLEKCDLCDTVTIQDDGLGIHAKAQIIKVQTDCLLEKYISVEIGDIQNTLSGTIAGQKQEIQKKPSASQMEVIASQMVSKILGAKGGTVRFLDENGDGEPDTLYIADHADPLQAQKVWRFNYEGWGASENGYNGPFELAATLEDGFYADFITAGVLTANLIQAGVLKTADGETFFLDLDSGVLRMNATELFISGVTVDEIAQEKASSVEESAADALNEYAARNEENLNGLQNQIEQTGDDLETQITETDNRLQEKINQNSNNLEAYKNLVGAFLRFDTQGLTIGREGSPFTAVLDDQRLSFRQDGTEVAYISNNKLYITNAEVLDRFTVGNAKSGYFDWIPRANGNLGMKWRAG